MFALQKTHLGLSLVINQQRFRKFLILEYKTNCMVKVSKFLLKVLTNSFLVSIICLLVSFLCKEGTIANNVFGFIGFYGSLVTINVFFIFLIFFLLTPLFRGK
jgi:hypothetical protein